MSREVRRPVAAYRAVLRLERRHDARRAWELDGLVPGVWESTAEVERAVLRLSLIHI